MVYSFEYLETILENKVKGWHECKILNYIDCQWVLKELLGQSLILGNNVQYDNKYQILNLPKPSKG